MWSKLWKADGAFHVEVPFEGSLATQTKEEHEESIIAG